MATAMEITWLRPLLKETLEKEARTAWSNMALEGETMDAIVGVKLASKSANAPWLRYPGKLTEHERLFAVQAQSNNINCESNQARWGFANSPHCRSCDAGAAGITGSTRHVLNCCETRLHLVRDRHDAVLDILGKHLPEDNPKYGYIIDQVPPPHISGSTVRPDVQGEPKPGSGTAWPILIRDAQNNIFIDNSDNRNIAKYNHIARAWEEHSNPRRRCELYTLIIPSVGPIPAHSETVPRKVGIKKPAKVLSVMSTVSTKMNAKFAASLNKALGRPPTSRSYPMKI
jgi:hypothetical protein